MESQAVQAASLAIIVASNLLACCMLWTEYSSHRLRYLKFAALAQTLLLAWHLTSVVSVVYGESPLIRYLSATTFFFAVCYYLAVSLHDRFSSERSLHRLVMLLAAGLLLLALLLAGGAMPYPFWIVNVLLLVALPIVSFIKPPPNSREIVVLFQAIIACLFLGSGTFFLSGYPVIGGLLFLVMGIFQPVLSFIFISTSIKASRNYIAARERDYRIFFQSVNDVFFRLDVEGAI